MQIQIVDEPVRFNLCGFSSAGENYVRSEVGLPLMNEMQKLIKSSRIADR